jgi:superfamily II DNA or RNA helicase
MKSVALTPAGHLTLPIDELLHLGWSEPEAELPPDVAYWRDLARSVVGAVCTTPGIEELRERADFTPSAERLDELLLAAPPMTGGEYLNTAVLTTIHQQLLEAVRAELAAHPRQTVQELFAAKSEAWHVVGKVHLHLAENKRDPERPFAFLATYTTGLSTHGKPQHRPLGDAVRESSSARDKDRLLALLLPVKRAAETSAFVKELVDSGQLFRPLAWSAREAHRFLKELAALEASGVIVRVPDWWKARRPPRPVVSVALGGKQPSALGLEAMLDFSVSVSVGGEQLTADELEALRAGGEGLVLLKGKWVEVDRTKLEQVLAHWRSVEKQASDGISFLEGMRLLSGASITEATDALPDVQAWTKVAAGPWLTQTLQSLRAPGNADPGDGLKAELRPYQRAGVQWLALLSQLRLGACLADDMGLGKTVQVLALLLLLQRKSTVKGPHLLVVPASLIANWKLEAAKFAPGLNVIIAHPSELPAKELTASEPASIATADVVITSYGTLHRVPWFKARRWGLLVLDEAQAIKNAGAQQTRAVKQLQGTSRVALTGTPVENRLGDLWSIFDFLNPGLLGTTKQFSAFVKASTSFGPLRELTRPYILRRLKTDRTVIADLPEKTELKAWCSLSKRQAALYQESVESLAKDLRQATGMSRRGLVISYLLRLKQLCNHPSQYLEDGQYRVSDSGKHERLQQLCEEIASRQEKVLVFTQFREMTKPLATWLEGVFGKPGLVLSGETAVKKRQQLVKQFQEDEALPFFVLSLKAGGTGLNLTAASHVIHFDRWWNPSVENQATDRAFRIGQKRNVLVHKFICRGTIEERVDEMIEAKRKLSTDLLEGGEELKLTELDDGALLKLVSLDLHSARAEA